MAIPLIGTGDFVDAADWNAIVDAINYLSHPFTVTGTLTAVKVSIGGTTPSAQLHLYGPGQTTAALTDAGNTGAMLFLDDSLASGGNGGAIRFGAAHEHYGAIKGLLYSSTGQSTGAVSVSVRALAADTALTEIARFVPYGGLGLGIDTPATQLHVKGTNQATSAMADASIFGGALYLQDVAGLTGSGGAALFGSGYGFYAGIKGLQSDFTGNSRGQLAFSLRRLAADTAMTEVMRLDPTGCVYINETSNAKQTLGLTIHQGGNGDDILSFKSTQVGHGFTDYAEADTYGGFLKDNGSNGGLRVRGFGDSGQVSAVVLEGFAGGSDTTKNAASTAAVMISGVITNGGTGSTVMGANANILVVRNETSTKIIFDAEGDAWQDAATGWQTYDGEDDVAMLNLATDHLTREDDPLKASFMGWLDKSRAPLERMGLVRFSDTGHPFVNLTRLQMLTVGAARQTADRLVRLEERFVEMERQLNP